MTDDDVVFVLELVALAIIIIYGAALAFVLRRR
jgi:hypothetical protein